MSDDIIEKPECRVLYRQSSLETRLSPVHLSEESNSESDDDEKKINRNIVQSEIENTQSNIITPLSSRKCNTIEKMKFQEELGKKLKLNMSLPQNKLTNKNVNNNHGSYTDETIDNNKTETLVKPKSKLKQISGGNLAFKDELKRKFEGEQMRNTHGKNKVKPAVPIRTSSKCSLNVSREMREKLEIENNREQMREAQDEPKTSMVEKTNESSVGTIKISNINRELETKESLDIEQGNHPQEITLVDAQNETQRHETTIAVGLLKALSITTNKEQETVGKSYCEKEEMATARPKSPRPVALRGEKDESIWDKLGTLGRKKRIKEVQEVQAEGKYAIDSPGCPTAPIIPPEEYNLDDNEERCMIDRRAYEDPKFNELLNVLKEWINDELASQRIIVQDLSEDLYDGQVLQKLLEKLTGDKLDVPEVTQSEEGQKQKLSVVLGHFNQHVSVDVVVVQKVKGVLNHKIVRESLTKAYDDVGMRCERDAFDTLFDHAPDKLQVVKKNVNFAFVLMEEVGLQKPKARPEDVVNMDLKSTLRVLYNLFLKYKTIL
ncbi:hypothetical protein NQ314_001149 [Rhamnusium bicolor]|uniref:Calponin-homology (CH) domain-containing protein n=1 Tax=Rhamnusium bicolor TaxID=1586634 RepID=A0AAV8ZSL5_9CUCU|nr:hypothetical protein NQ314_001149 [Rhamnusium bicolor]